MEYMLERVREFQGVRDGRRGIIEEILQPELSSAGKEGNE